MFKIEIVQPNGNKVVATSKNEDAEALYNKLYELYPDSRCRINIDDTDIICGAMQMEFAFTIRCFARDIGYRMNNIGRQYSYRLPRVDACPFDKSMIVGREVREDSNDKLEYPYIVINSKKMYLAPLVGKEDTIPFSENDEFYIVKVVGIDEYIFMSKSDFERDYSLCF